MRESQYQEAAELGVANKHAMQLLANHCRHARVELSHGTSLLGQMLDLPIGMAQVRCEHAEQPRVMSMHVTELAMDFYNSNCVGCPHRAPNGLLPTIANLADERRLRAEEAGVRAAADRVAAIVAWEARRSARHQAVSTEGYPARDLAADLDLLDPHPDADASQTTAMVAERRRIVETARRAPQVFTARLVSTVIDLAVCHQDPTACTVLRLLARAGLVEPRVAVDTAATILAQAPIAEAGQTVAELTAEATLDLLEATLSSLISLAAEHDDFPLARRTAEPAGLLAVSDLDLPMVTDAIVDQLSDDDEGRRAEAADAATVLLQVDPQRVVALGRPLVRSIRSEDEGYAGTPRPSGSAARALAEAWRGCPGVTSRLMEDEAPALTEDGRSELFRVLLFLRRWHDDTPIHDEAAAVAAAFSVRRLSADWGVKVADRAAEQLEELVANYPLAVVPQTEAVLAALLAVCSREQVSPLLVPDRADQDPLAGELKVLQDMAAHQSRENRRRRLSTVIGRLAHHDTSRVLPAVIDLLQASTGDDDLDATIRSWLVRVIAEAIPATKVADVLPILYTCLLSTEQLVRTAAIDLWEACAKSADRLPEELTDLAAALLTDRYVIVHAAMLRTLPQLGLPDEKAATLLNHFVGWAMTYAGKDEPRRLEDALYGMLWAAHRSGDQNLNRNTAVWAISLSRDLGAHDRERLLLYSSAWELRSSEIWAHAAMEVLADRARYTFNVREDDLLAALLEDPSGLRTLPLSLFRASARIHMPHYVGLAAVPVELLQATGRYADAAALAADLADAVPDTREYRNVRWYLSALAAACATEVAAIAGLPALPLPAVPANANRAAADEPSFVTHTGSRTAARDALATIPVPEPSPAADILSEAAALALRGPGSQLLRRHGDALGIGSHLLRHDAAVRAADPSAATHLAAGRRAATVLNSTLNSSLPDDDALRTWVTAACDASTETVDSLLDELRRLPAPLPLASPVTYRRFGSASADRADRSHPDDVAERPLAVCVLSLDEQPIVDVVVLRIDHVYDLSIDIRLDTWPDWADHCHVSLLTVLTPDALTRPEFMFARTHLIEDEHGLTLSATGSLRCTVERPAGRPPLDLPVHVQFTGRDGQREHAEIGGYRRLRLRPYDPSRDALTQHTQIDQRLLELYDPLHDDPTLDQDDIQAFCRLFTACVRAAQNIMFDNAFRSGRRITEQQFHDNLEQRLRSDPELGGRLTRRDPVAGGFDDLLHDDIVAELKVEKKTPRTVEDCARYLGQPTQYGVGRGSRLSILVILDHTRKAAPPAVLENHIGWLFPAHHGLDHPRYPSRVGVLIINTNWPVPSAWSRRRVPTRPDTPAEPSS